MDPVEDKKRIANEKRLKAVQEWQKKRNQQNNFKPVHRSFVSPVKTKNKKKLDLLDSDEDEDDNEISLDIHAQFEGQSGQHLLEKSIEYSDRFKLDERFKLDDQEPSEAMEENEEKVKNMQILESILGHQVSERYPEERNATKKRNIMRFDPEDENSTKYIKRDETFEEKPPKKIRKLKDVSKDETKDLTPISTKRYIEVNTNLKEILKSASSSQFSLTAKFNFSDNQADLKKNEDFSSPFSTSDRNFQHENKSKFNERSRDISKRPINTFENKKKFTFFIPEDDACLKEGLEFFQRPKPIEEIRTEWDKTKDEILELLRKKRKTSLRGYVTKPNASQRNKQFAKNKKF